MLIDLRSSSPLTVNIVKAVNKARVVKLFIVFYYDFFLRACFSLQNRKNKLQLRILNEKFHIKRVTLSGG